MLLVEVLGTDPAEVTECAVNAASTRVLRDDTSAGTLAMLG